MCQLCFVRVEQEDLNVTEDGQKEDVCKKCAEEERVIMEAKKENKDKMHHHSIIFTRQGNFGKVTDVAICVFKSENENAKEALCKAVSSWVRNTPDGLTAWEDSCEDFNIGDLSVCQSPNLLNEHGVYELHVQVFSGENWEYFDKHLVDEKTE